MVPEISIIIVSWNGKAVLKKCLNSIFNRNYNFSYEVIVVDNGSKDGTVEMLKNDFRTVKIKENKKNLGFPIANNLGIKMAQGKFILLLNQDIELEENTLETLFNFLKNNLKNNIVAVAPMLQYPNGKVQMSLRPFPTPGNILKDAFSFGRWHLKYYDYRKSQEVEQPMASCLLVEGRTLRRVKGFDPNPNFFLYFNDVDLSFRISLLGLKHYYLNNCKAIHDHGQSAKKWSELSRLGAWQRGLYYFLAKHYAKKRVLSKLIFKIEVFLIFLIRVITESLKSLLLRK